MYLKISGLQYSYKLQLYRFETLLIIRYKPSDPWKTVEYPFFRTNFCSTAPAFRSRTKINVCSWIENMPKKRSNKRAWKLRTFKSGRLGRQLEGKREIEGIEQIYSLKKKIEKNCFISRSSDFRRFLN